jgi:hypothetical protein
MSLKKGLSVSVKVQEMNKDGFQPILGGIIYGMFALLAFMIRLGSIVLYFSVPLGLYNLLAHYQYEYNGFQWNEDALDRMYNGIGEQSENVYLANVTYTEKGPISITKYTGLSMKSYYVIFLFGMLAHFLLMFIKSINDTSKLTNQSEKKFSLKNWFFPVLRAFTSFVLPEVSTDWDENAEWKISTMKSENNIEVC